MKITHYLYNAFVIESGGRKIAIDPGGLFLYFFRLTTLIPKQEWPSITHLLVTHGDPDHYWHFERVAKASGARLVCNRTMVQEREGRSFMLGPRSKGVSFTMPVESPHTLGIDESIILDGIGIRGIKTTHGQLVIRIGPFSTTVVPGPEERVGWGAIGYEITMDGKTIINLGDTLLEAEAWRSLSKPDLLMIPIGGGAIHNTMDESEALQAVEILRPSLVIPCHYNCPALFTKNYNPADVRRFKSGVEEMGLRCEILRKGESISL